MLLARLTGTDIWWLTPGIWAPSFFRFRAPGFSTVQPWKEQGKASPQHLHPTVGLPPTPGPSPSHPSRKLRLLPQAQRETCEYPRQPLAEPQLRHPTVVLISLINLAPREPPQLEARTPSQLGSGPAKSEPLVSPSVMKKRSYCCLGPRCRALFMIFLSLF